MSQVQEAFEPRAGKSPPPECQLREPESPSAHFPFLFTNVSESLPDFSIGGMTIPSRTIIELIQHFGYQYHVHAHFIQPIESLARFFTTSPLLFWTIILLASHFHPTHSGLYGKLLLPHEELLRPFSNTAIQSVHEIHALLLLCLWPIPRRVEATNPTWNYIGLAVGACMRLDLDKASPPDPAEPRLNTTMWERKNDKISIQTRRLTWLACLTISTQPKFAIHEVICNYSLALEEVDSSSAQLSLVETFDRSLDIIRQTYSAEWSTDVDVLLQYAKLNLNATALVRILVENEGGYSAQLAEVQTLIIWGSKASSLLISDVKTLTSGAAAREGQSVHIPMAICYPRFYFEVMFFAAVFIFRTSYMRPPISRDAGIEGLIEVYNIYQLFPRHPDMRIGGDAIQRILRYRSSEESPWASSPLGGLTTTNRLGASIVWDTARHLTHLFSGVEYGRQADNEQAESQVPHHPIDGSSAVTQDAIIEGTPEEAGGLTFPETINLDWADMDLPLPTFDIFGLEAGEHIIW
ncbi:hypothetical protein EKO27_g8116 [Xylaria grammica]|uniref:Xylanolytic transcriptional activator regulatory domain-containing protein n=1 Tax=Xylaria grammica TaxID=363999 RepID=A0A439CXY1_9PEZI|nr:hypothetical protein EKO27_g8116 [Xylaria grammica]